MAETIQDYVARDEQNNRVFTCIFINFAFFNSTLAMIWGIFANLIRKELSDDTR